ncbi:MAG: KpsF/GutQ family sugar-phosphate isomerase [Acidobacteria bacterium]|nr:KpsF/GutQ family sugar-phosphate isomerase [Acidobacteriota bacterium]
MSNAEAVRADRYEKFRECLRVEQAAIERASERIDAAAVERAVDLLAKCRGKVIVTGVGKSGVIAEKIAQTMTSTGSSAVFLHPSDAMHGGLGIVGAEDIVIALSNSGETDELLVMLPSLTSRKLPVIAILGNIHSSVAAASAVVLDASVDKEACPLNLAPTASTTTALAVGDALAMAVMDAKGLTAEDFAANHPAGRLGRRLTLHVGDLMHTGADVAPDASWIEVVRAISDHSLGAVNVVGEDGALLGLVTDGDLRRTIERTDATQLEHTTARSMMTADPIATSPDAMAYDALRLMEDRPSQISVLPVVEDGRCVGLLRLHDVVKSGL